MNIFISNNGVEVYNDNDNNVAHDDGKDHVDFDKDEHYYNQ